MYHVQFNALWLRMMNNGYETRSIYYNNVNIAVLTCQHDLV